MLENIFRFIEEKHASPREAAVHATKEIGLAVLATTLSLVAIFVPVGFMGGIVGRFMKSFGLTMAFAIMVSLLVCFTLTPMLSARWLIPEAEGAKKKSSKDSGVFQAVDRLYTRLLEWSMAHRAIVAGVAVLVLLSSVPLFQMANKNFLPNDDQSEFEINLRAPEGTSLESTEVITNRIANAVRQRLAEVDYTLVTISGDPAGTRNLGNIYVRLKPIEERKSDQFALMGIVRSEVLPPLSTNLRTSVQPVANIGGGGSQAADVQFVVNGPDLKKLEQVSTQLLATDEVDPGRRRRGHVPERRKAGVVGADRPREGRGSRRPDIGRGGGSPPPRRRRSGDELQRRRRTVRSAPAGAPGRPLHRRPPCRA